MQLLYGITALKKKNYNKYKWNWPEEARGWVRKNPKKIEIETLEFLGKGRVEHRGDRIPGRLAKPPRPDRTLWRLTELLRWLSVSLPSASVPPLCYSPQSQRDNTQGSILLFMCVAVRKKYSRLLLFLSFLFGITVITTLDFPIIQDILTSLTCVINYYIHNFVFFFSTNFLLNFFNY